MFISKIEPFKHQLQSIYLLTKSNRTEIQTYEVEERIFGTPCIFIFLFRTHKHLQYITFAIHYNNFSLLVTKFYLTLKQVTVIVYRTEKKKKEINQKKKKTKSTKILLIVYITIKRRLPALWPSIPHLLVCHLHAL